MTRKRTRIGIFGWGVVAPKSPTIEHFEENLRRGGSWLEPFDAFGPSNFLVGNPEFDFSRYRGWIDERFEPRRFAQLESKMGPPVKYAIGAFIQALSQNEGLETELQELGDAAHIYVGTGLGDFVTEERIMVRYHRAQRHWNRFWCREEHHPELASYRRLSDDERQARRAELGAPEDPADHRPEDGSYDELLYEWFAFWIDRSEGLQRYLAELREIEGEGVGENIEAGKKSLIRRKMSQRKRLDQRYGCPLAPWSSVDAKILWNIDNIPAAQISMLGQITGATMSPVAACSGFGTALKLADNAIQLGQARACVVGMTDPPPHPLTVGGFSDARVVAGDGEVSKPFTGLRGTHVAGGACIWIVGDADYLIAKGMRPLGLEILGIALSSDADHIITPSSEGPKQAMRQAIAEAGVQPEEIATWDMHATATPGDWMELETALSILSPETQFTARKGTFGHGMAVCGGWELTAQHLAVAGGEQFPVDVDLEELHPQIRPYADSIVGRETERPQGTIAGKINMGVGGVNACVISRAWEDG